MQLKSRMIFYRKQPHHCHFFWFLMFLTFFLTNQDTLKRAVKAGDGIILATAPPYTRFMNQNTDFALISSGIPRADVWIQEFIRHEIPCVLSDYIVEYVCKPGYPLDKHVLYDTNSWAERSFNKLQLSAGEKVVSEEEELACEVRNLNNY